VHGNPHAVNHLGGDCVLWHRTDWKYACIVPPFIQGCLDACDDIGCEGAVQFRRALDYAYLKFGVWVLSNILALYSAHTFVHVAIAIRDELRQLILESAHVC